MPPLPTGECFRASDLAGRRAGEDAGLEDNDQVWIETGSGHDLGTASLCGVFSGFLGFNKDDESISVGVHKSYSGGTTGSYALET